MDHSSETSLMVFCYVNFICVTVWSARKPINYHFLSSPNTEVIFYFLFIRSVSWCSKWRDLMSNWRVCLEARLFHCCQLMDQYKEN